MCILTHISIAWLIAFSSGARPGAIMIPIVNQALKLPGAPPWSWSWWELTMSQASNGLGHHGTPGPIVPYRSSHAMGVALRQPWGYQNMFGSVACSTLVCGVVIIP